MFSFHSLGGPHNLDLTTSPITFDCGVALDAGTHTLTAIFTLAPNSPCSPETVSATSNAFTVYAKPDIKLSTPSEPLTARCEKIEAQVAVQVPYTSSGTVASITFHADYDAGTGYVVCQEGELPVSRIFTATCQGHRHCTFVAVQVM